RRAAWPGVASAPAPPSAIGVRPSTFRLLLPSSILRKRRRDPMPRAAAAPRLYRRNLPKTGSVFRSETLVGGQPGVEALAELDVVVGPELDRGGERAFHVFRRVRQVRPHVGHAVLILADQGDRRFADRAIGDVGGLVGKPLGVGREFDELPGRVLVG